ncbi:MAG: beta-1,6-N-acetylglucosaminyltransferase [Actinomycetota bacterium]|nr:beta-1,6-N-acetylglucosaminyltransferase [Actinomycetota bacterium]
MRSRLAYVVVAHKNPSQVGRLLQQLATDRSTFLVHVDRRAGRAVHAEMRRHAAGVPRVHFLARRRCFWAGFGMVGATLDAMAYVVRTGTPADHIVLISGQDYPLRGAEEIETFFGEHQDRSFISARPMHDAWKGKGFWRIDMWHRISYNKLHLRVPWQRRIPGGLAPYGGEAWMSLSAAAARHVVDVVRANPRLVRFFKHVLHPDEIFFHTILMNSPLRKSVVNDHLRYIDWNAPGAVDHPATLGSSDFETLVRSQSLFGRKFDVTVDATILDLLDEHVRKRAAAVSGA